MPRLAALATQLLSTTYRVVISTKETAKLGLFAGLAALYGLVALLLTCLSVLPRPSTALPRHRQGRRHQSSSSNRRGVGEHKCCDGASGGSAFVAKVEACIDIDGRHIVLPVREETELHGGGAFMTRYELKGAVDGSIDPILTIVIKDEGVEYRLVDAVTGEALGDVSGVGCPRSHRGD